MINYEKNIVCFGTCDMLWNGGFIAGLREKPFNVVTFGFSNISAASHIYNLKRDQNIGIINNADLIILGISEESGVESVYRNNIRNYKWLYKELYKLQKKVVVVIWYYYQLYSNRYENFHQDQCFLYGFNLVDTYAYCKENNILDLFLKIPDCHHPIFEISKRVAIEIGNNINKYHYPKNDLKISCNPKFLIFEIKEQENFTLVKFRNHIRAEFILNQKSNISVDFPKKYHGLILLGVHTWNRACQIDHSCYVLENNKYCFGKMAWGWETFSEIYLEDFIIDDSTRLHVDYDNSISKQISWPLEVGSHGIGLIGFLLVDKTTLLEDDDYRANVGNDNIYNFSNIVGFLKEYSKIIEQYNCKLLLDNKEEKRKSEMFDFIIKYGTAKTRIQNQLSYRLGQAMIVNSKSLLGYIRMPFVLSYIKDKHKQEQQIYQEKIKQDSSLVLPSLENYHDYEEALKEKECLSYKLGQALIQASKTWYKGGYIKLLFEIKRIKSKSEIK